MRTVLGVLIAAALAVVFALWFKTLEGYVVFVVPPYRGQMSLQLLGVLALLALLVGYALLRLVASLVSAPGALRAWRARRRLEQALARLADAASARLIGKPKAAFAALDAVHRLPNAAATAAVEAFEAALAVQDEARAENALARLPEHGQWAAARAVLEARFGLAFGRLDRLEAALAALAADSRVAPTVRERLRLAATRQLGQWEQALEAARKLRRHEALPLAEFLPIAVSAFEALLRARLQHNDDVLAWWQAQPKEERRLPELVAAVVQTVVAHGARADALAIAESFLRERYASEVLAAALPVLPADLTWLTKLERWLMEAPSDAVLLEALVRLTLAQRLTGKARDYFERLYHADAARARRLAAEMLEAQGALMSALLPAQTAAVPTLVPSSTGTGLPSMTSSHATARPTSDKTAAAPAGENDARGV